MKIKLTFKHPDAVNCAIHDNMNEYIRIYKEKHGEDLDKRDARELMYEQITSKIKYGEQITVEVDLDTGETVVV